MKDKTESSADCEQKVLTSLIVLLISGPQVKPPAYIQIISWMLTIFRYLIYSLKWHMQATALNEKKKCFSPSSNRCCDKEGLRNTEQFSEMSSLS